jgi:hypothetical protein
MYNLKNTIMKTHFAFGLILGVLISLAAVALYSFNRPNYEQIAREQSAEIARIKLENDTLKETTIQVGWYESQFAKLEHQ